MLALILLAQQPNGGAEGLLGNPLLMFVPILILGYFLLIRPAQRQRREQDAMLKALKKNDRVIAAGGILGTVANIKDNDEEVTLKVDDNVRIRVLRSSIVKVLVASDAAEKEQKPAEST